MSEQQGEPVDGATSAEECAASVSAPSPSVSERLAEYFNRLPEMVDDAHATVCIEAARAFSRSRLDDGYSFLENLSSSSARLMLTECGVNPKVVEGIAYLLELRETTAMVYPALCEFAKAVQEVLSPVQQLQCEEEWSRVEAKFFDWLVRHPMPSAEEWRGFWGGWAVETFDFCARWGLASVQWQTDGAMEIYTGITRSLAAELVRVMEDGFKKGAQIEIVLLPRFTHWQAEALRKRREWMETALQNQKTKRMQQTQKARTAPREGRRALSAAEQVRLRAAKAKKKTVAAFVKAMDERGGNALVDRFLLRRIMEGQTATKEQIDLIMATADSILTPGTSAPLRRSV